MDNETRVVAWYGCDIKTIDCCNLPAYAAEDQTNTAAVGGRTWTYESTKQAKYSIYKNHVTMLSELFL